MLKSGQKLEVKNIFIGSPDDVVKERRLFNNIINEINEEKAHPYKIRLIPLAWEDRGPGTGRPQELINEYIENSDLVVMLLWNKWGSPTGRYSSGFEEEYEVARHNKKEIWFYFRSNPEELLLDQGPQIKKVLKFKKKIEGKYLYKPYDNHLSWAELFRKRLCRWLDDLNEEKISIKGKKSSSDNKKFNLKLKDYTDSEKIKELEAKLLNEATGLVNEAIDNHESKSFTILQQKYVKALEFSTHPWIRNYYGLFLLKFGLFEKAYQQFQSALEDATILGKNIEEFRAIMHLGIMHELRFEEDLAKKRFRKANSLLKKIGEDKVKSSALFFWGIAFLELKQYKRSLNKFKMSLEYNAKNYFSLIGWGTALSRLEHYGEAIQKFEAALSINPRDHVIHYNLGICYNALNLPKDTHKSFQKAAKMNPKDAKIYIQWASTLQKLNNPLDGIKKCRKAIQVNPSSAIAYFNWGVLLGDLGRYREASMKFSLSIEFDQTSYFAYCYLGDSLSKIGEEQEAVKAFKKAVRIDPDKGEAFSFWGAMLRDSGKLKEALKLFKKAAAVAPGNGVIQSQISHSLSSLGHHDEALKQYEAVEKLGYRRANIYVGWGFSLLGCGKYHEAVKVLRKALRLDAKSAAAYQNIGSAYRKLGKLSTAANNFRKSITLDPGNFNVHFALGNVSYSLKKYEDAIDSFQSAASIRPKDGAIYCKMGCVFSDTQDYENAITMFKKALRLDHIGSHVYYNLGQNHNNKNDIIHAKKNFEMVVKKHENIAQVSAAKNILTLLNSGAKIYINGFTVSILHQ